MNILLTGAMGFVGKKIFYCLHKAGHNVVPLVRSGQEELALQHLGADRVLSSPDIFRMERYWWSSNCKGFDAVVHAAWYATPGKYLMSEKNLECLTGSLELARGAIDAGVGRFVGIGTCFEYDLNHEKLSIETPLKPSTLYGVSKASLFMLLEQMFQNNSVDFSWCRLFYLYGDGEDERRFIPYLKKQLSEGNDVKLTEGTQVRDFMDVSEVGERIANVVSGQQVGAINICSGKPITIRAMAEKIADDYGRRDLLKFGARPKNLLDPPVVLGVANDRNL